MSMTYEESADKVRIIKPDGTEIEGWLPKAPTDVVWLDEHMGRYVAATDLPCPCGRRMGKGWTKCGECRHKMDMERWDKAYASATPWEGGPLCEYDGDRFLWDETAVGEYLFEWFENGNPLEDIKLTHCKPANGSHFVMSEFLQDDLGEDVDLDEDEINAAVNKWISDHAPFSYFGDPSRPVLISSFQKIWDEIIAESKSQPE